MQPQVQYAHTADGVAIAYAVVGEGPPLLFARPFIHPGLDDEIARSTQFWPALRESHSVVLWDIRGVGLSGTAPEAGFDDWLADMEAVADATGADRFDLVGVQGPCHLAMAYAARRPDRINRLVLHTPSPPGFSPRRNQPWLFALAPDHWHDFVDMLALRLYGWNQAGVAQRWADRIRAHFTAEQYLRYMDAVESIDATDDARSIRTPALVIDDSAATRFANVVTQQQFAPFARQLAATIPGAQLAIIKEGDAQVAQVVERFLSGSSGAAETHPGAASSDTAIILFTDIADSSAITERVGDTAFHSESRTLDEAVRAAIRDAGGSPVEGKVLGDGVMGVFTSASQAITAARACVELGRELPMHIGIHAGDVITDGSTVYGGAVNIASRICGLCPPGDILVSRTVADLARTSAGVTFEDRGEHALKGIAEPVRVYAVAPSRQ